jgi:hypothetical protein
VGTTIQQIKTLVHAENIGMLPGIDSVVEYYNIAIENKENLEEIKDSFNFASLTVLCALSWDGKPYSLDAGCQEIVGYVWEHATG